jgi:hypothetical protein
MSYKILMGEPIGQHLGEGGRRCTYATHSPIRIL